MLLYLPLHNSGPLPSVNDFLNGPRTWKTRMEETIWWT